MEFLIIALCLHAVYTIHNSIRHGLDFNGLDGQSKFKCLFRVLMQKCLSAAKTVQMRQIVQHLGLAR